MAATLARLGLVAGVALSRATAREADCSGASATIVVHADTVLVPDLSDALVGNGIEDVNHELVGGIYTSMLFGESFEEPEGPNGISTGARATWAALAPVPPSCGFSVLVGDAFTGRQSQALATARATSAACGVVNRGLDSGGLSFAPGVAYSLRFFAKALGQQQATPLVVALLDSRSQQAVVSATIYINASTSWMAYVATLEVPTAFSGTLCFQDAAPLVPCASNSDSLCITCSGALSLALPAGAAAASVLLDQVSLSALSGGPGPADGLPASRRDVVALLGRDGWQGSPGMGLSALRLGGSAILVDGYRWKAFRGVQELRQPYGGFWYGPPSSTAWGFFEFLALCERLSSIRVCVTTMNSAETLQDVADFLEYVYGDAETTLWGAQRAADGHAAPYMPFAIEIGNEQDHTSATFIAQVAAFASTLASTSLRLALPFKLTTLIGATPGTWPAASFLPMAAALNGTAFAPLDILIDFHVGGDTPATDPLIAFAFVAGVRDLLASVASPIRGAVLEENGGRHDMQRALGHARNSNRLHCLGSFVRIETAANGLQMSGRNDNAWDQGALFLTQNSTFLAPHGMANVLLSAADEASVVAIESAGLASAPTLDVVAVFDAARTMLTVRAVNFGSAAVAASVSLLGCAVAGAGVSASVLVLNASSPTATNLPWAPLLVAPVTSTVAVPASGAFSFTFVPYSISSLSVPCVGGPPAPASSLRGVQTTCDAPSSGPTNVSVFGHIFETYNNAPWQVTAASLALDCNELSCYDEGITVDSPLPGSGSASVSVTFRQQAAVGDDDAGLLVRCGIAGVGPGMDSFSCYEVSLGPNKAGAGSGFVLLGAHWLPSHWQLLQQVPFDVPAGVAHTLSVALVVSPSSVGFVLRVNGAIALAFNDTTFVSTIGGGHVGLRSFYSDVLFETLSIGAH